MEIAALDGRALPALIDSAGAAQLETNVNALLLGGSDVGERALGYVGREPDAIDSSDLVAARFYSRGKFLGSLEIRSPGHEGGSDAIPKQTQCLAWSEIFSIPNDHLASRTVKSLFYPTWALSSLLWHFSLFRSAESIYYCLAGEPSLYKLNYNEMSDKEKGKITGASVGG